MTGIFNQDLLRPKCLYVPALRTWLRRRGTGYVLIFAAFTCYGTYGYYVLKHGPIEFHDVQGVV